jgi:DNA-directed RNA polymerase subunit omega
MASVAALQPVAAPIAAITLSQESASMSERASLIHPPIEDLLDKVDSKFSLVSLAAKRGRQINSYFSQLGEGLGAIVPPQVASVSRKPLTIALEEIAANKITFVRIEDPESPDDPAK